MRINILGPAFSESLHVDKKIWYNFFSSVVENSLRVIGDSRIYRNLNFPSGERISTILWICGIQS